MKTQSLVLLGILMVSTALRSHAEDGIKFEHSSWEEVTGKARLEGKYIFVDFYATWCGPCKYMSRDVFTDESVGAFFNRNFISFKVDAENEEAELVESISLEAYPTLVFFDSDGSILYQHIGATDGEGLIQLGERVASYRKNESRVNDGTATRDQLLAYLSIAKNADPEGFAKSSKSVLGTVTAGDLANADIWSVVTAELNDVNDPLFADIVSNASTLNEVHEDYVDYVGGVLSAHLTAMADAGNIDGLDVYKNYMASLYEQLSDQEYASGFFDLQANAAFYLLRNEMDTYGTTIVALVEGHMMKDAANLAAYALDFTSYFTEGPFGEKALAWALQAIELDRSKDNVYTLAVVYERIGQKEKAIQCAKEILEFELEDDERTFVNDYLQQLQS